MSVHAGTCEVSRHKCLIYEGHPSEQLPVVVPLLVASLRDDWRCLYLGDPACVRMVTTALEERGIDVARERGRGALILTSEREHLVDGKFDPRAMVDTLRGMVDDALKDGFGGLCATGDMMWELGSEENFTKLLEYEALLEQLFHEVPLQGICQYRRDVVPPEAIDDALLVHRSVYVGQTLSSENLFYVPFEQILGDGKARGEWMSEQILRVMKAEQKRDAAILSLRESESQQRELAERLALANRELEERVRQRTAELEATNRELESFSYSVSHDLRGPLRAIGSVAHTLASEFGDALGEEGLKCVRKLKTSVERMAQQIDSLLALARLSKAELRYTSVDLDRIAAEVILDLQSAEPSRHMEVSIEKGIRVRGDSGMLRSLLQNLLENAWKFTSKKPVGRIEFGRSEPIDGMDVFYIRDNGDGFDMQHARQLFQTFQRLHTHEEFPGTGIGLAIVQRIVQRHRGKVWAEGVSGDGATFYVALPASAKHR